MPEHRQCAACGEVRFIKARELCTRCYQRPGVRERYDRTRSRSLDEWLADVARPVTGCHLWPGPLSELGYPYLRTGGRTTWVHREVWEREHGPMRDGHEPDHTCRTPACVRVDHIEEVTSAENKRRAVPHRSPSKRRLGKCPHDDADVYVDPTGKRVCRICRRTRVKLWKADRGAVA